jgi:hypothetical protein
MAVSGGVGWLAGVYSLFFLLLSFVLLCFCVPFVTDSCCTFFRVIGI